jgi:glycosyltransferase involved in cell wall biosynthesis
MKVLLAHNFYRSSAPSGEDSVYRNERKLLENRLEVVAYERHNDDIDESTLAKKMALAKDCAWSKRTYQELKALIQETRPDVAHFHNTFPLISPSAYAACRELHVPVIQTLHNFRLICPNALLLREGKPCEACVGTNLLPALRYRCYRDSLVATAAQVWALQSNRWRGTYQHLVNCYIAPSQFSASRLIAGGIPSDRMEVKGHFLPDPPPPGPGNGGYVLFVGRLSKEKGAEVLINAWRHISNVPLKIIGDGELRRDLEAEAVRCKLDVEFLGFLPHAEVLALMGNALALVMPSLCYETFGMAGMESFALGTPVLASRIGSLSELVEDGVNGLKFEAGNPRDLADKVLNLKGCKEALPSYRKRARMTFESKYAAAPNADSLITIYKKMIAEAATQADH